MFLLLIGRWCDIEYRMPNNKKYELRLVKLQNTLDLQYFFKDWIEPLLNQFF